MQSVSVFNQFKDIYLKKIEIFVKVHIEKGLTLIQIHRTNTDKILNILRLLKLIGQQSSY